MAMMALLDAFRAVAGLCGDDEVDAQRDAAAEVLLRELRTIAHRNFGRAEDRNDAVDLVLESMIKNGPRGVRATDPDTDDNVRVWLSVSWTRKVIALGRTTGRLTHVDDVVEVLKDPQPGIEAAVELKRLAAEIESARRQLFDDIAPKLRSDVIAGLSEIADGRLTVNEIVNREEPNAIRGSSEWQNARRRIDQRNHRAIVSLRKESRALRDRGEISWLRSLALEVVISELQVRGRRQLTSNKDGG